MNAGILPILSLILGYEDETEAGINKTFSLLLELYRKEKPMVSYFHILSIVTGTHLYNREVKHLVDEGHILIEEYIDSQIVINLTTTILDIVSDKITED